MRFNTVSTADQYIIAYQPFYRQTLLLSPLKSLWREALWVITHLQQQLAQLKLSEDTVVAELEPQVRVAKGDAVLWCHIAGDWRIWWGILICSFLPTCKAKFSWHFGSGRLRYDTVPPKKFSKYSKMIPHMMPPFTVYILYLFIAFLFGPTHFLLGKPLQLDDQGRGHVLQQANGLGSRLATIW